MRDDVSAIPSSGCAVLTGSNSISFYPSTTQRIDFIFNGNKWYKYRTQNSNYGYDLCSYNCIDVSTLNSNAVFEPFIYGFGFVLFLVSLALVIKVVKGFLYGI